MDKQMNLFEPVERGFEDGGLMQEGGTVDPVSGNDVPIGSTQEEVRDDIPAQLSEGEFVFPADVVRYWGLDMLMKMRQQAKAGLQMMDDMGQMGNSEEAIIPDDIPFDVNDLDMEDDGVVEYAQGGVVKAQVGAFMQPQPTGMLGTQQSQFANYSQMPQQIGTPPIQQPIMPTAPYQPPMQQATPIASTTPSFLGTGMTGGMADMSPPDEYRTYRNEAGQEIQVPFRGGKVHPTFTIPSGYKPTSEFQPKVEDTKIDTTQVTQQPQQDDDGPTQGDPVIGEFSTTDMRGVGYDRGKIGKESGLVDELDAIAKAQLGEIGPIVGMAAGFSPVGGILQKAARQGAIEAGVGKYKDTKGVDPRKEFLTSQKVTMDAMLAGLDATYGGARGAFEGGKGTAGQRLHELTPEVKRALAGELKTNREALSTALEGKTAADLVAEINNTQEGLGKDLAELGIEKTYNDGKAERDKTYGQLFAEARATKAARDKIASQYGFDAKGMSLSDARKKGQEVQDLRERMEQAQTVSERQYDDDDGRSLSASGTKDISTSFGASVGEGMGMGFLNKGGLVQQMEKSGLTPKK